MQWQIPVSPSTWEAEAGDSKFKPSLGNLARTCLQLKENRKKKSLSKEVNFAKERFPKPHILGSTEKCSRGTERRERSVEISVNEDEWEEHQVDRIMFTKSWMLVKEQGDFEIRPEKTTKRKTG